VPPRPFLHPGVASLPQTLQNRTLSPSNPLPGPHGEESTSCTPQVAERPAFAPQPQGARAEARPAGLYLKVTTPDPLSERDWRDLLRLIHDRQVIPVVGPCLVTVGHRRAGCLAPAPRSRSRSRTGSRASRELRLVERCRARPPPGRRRARAGVRGAARDSSTRSGPIRLLPCCRWRASPTSTSSSAAHPTACWRRP